MSWKTFWQIVLLMVIGVVILESVKCGLFYSRQQCKAKFMKHMPNMPMEK